MRKHLAGLGALLLAGACATAPQVSAPLDQARATYRMAATDPQVQLRAPVELAMAERSLARAERLWRENEPAESVAHHAYLAEQRSRIALKTAEYRIAEAAVATSREQRTRVLLEAREREAAQAKARAEDAERRARELALTRDVQNAEARQGAELGAEVSRLQAEVEELKAQQTERGWVLTLKNDLLFDTGSATLKPGAQRAIDNLAQFMRRHPGRDIEIEGFTDSAGSEETNRRLSSGRAAAVKRALVARGIAGERIDARGYGPAFPVASNDTPVGRQLNRRVEIVINPS